ncbi:MAG: molybdopterin-containing oxidoreductase family protein [Bacillota bacterium]
MEDIRTVCPLDCWDQCGLIVKKDGGKIKRIEADSTHPITGHLICSKGMQYLQRANHPDRLRQPLLKKDNSFVPITWPQALETMASKIKIALDEYGPLSLLHFYDGGYNGLIKNIESRFFSALGGCTMHKGSLCWSAGLAAQKYDFGAVVSHPYQDLLNAKMIIVWGRNPAYTSIHQMNYIRQARAAGSKVIVIDPVLTSTADNCDQFVRIKPGTDGALALGMARVIIENDYFDQGFVEKHSTGFDRFADLCGEYTAAKTSEITGVPEEVIEELAFAYVQNSPSAILVGIGLQRHSNGGNTVRAIDALAALSGNIGRTGGGVNYVNFQVDRFIDHGFLSGNDLNPKRRYYPKPQLAKAIMTLEDPSVQFLYISRANPMVQVGDSNSLAEAFKKVPFIVTADHFMTDTAAASDLVLPCTNFLEEEDFYYNSMGHQCINYSFKVSDPPGECRSEYDYFKELARLLRLDHVQFPQLGPDELIARSIKPLTEKFSINIQMIREQSPLMLPEFNEIPWQDGKFQTADGRYNFYSKAAEMETGYGLPEYRPPLELSNSLLKEKGYKYWFVTPHPRNSIHSTHRLPGSGKKPTIHLHPKTAREEGLSEKRQVKVITERGHITAGMICSERVRRDTVMIVEGWWHFSGAAVNRLTADRMTDFGDQAAYYDCLCRLEKI